MKKIDIKGELVKIHEALQRKNVIADPEVVASNNFIPSLGIISGIEEPKNGMVVAKFGRTTKLTFGIIRRTGARLTLPVNGKMVAFKNQLVIEGTGKVF